MLKCPQCGEDNPDIIELLDNGMRYCAGCGTATLVEQPPRLLDPEPRRRKDTDL